jgi:hypothetical protein
MEIVSIAPQPVQVPPVISIGEAGETGNSRIVGIFDLSVEQFEETLTASGMD